MKIVELPENFMIMLDNLPENGMGYQIVNIVLDDGRILRDRIVYNSTFLKLGEGENIKTEQIKEISI